ncbi:hypothetical protein Acid345_0946 [Candidatus Koribacter versatilis Ellin345]|uniref:Uncharacterized protein n=1 Tax=Koribacter versatilis (strain Ellin345) TaxID=204669 RepID=Q1IT51_KORVE|nr:hypothetical protein [Candidatus Koribacter versatilis]ABF39949.1 hypothetical protein Acid345_0946 [Candidatus Koribacter versatilis Ellin345]
MLRRILCALLFSTALFAQSPVVLGVFEDSMGALEQDPHIRGLRAVFYKSGTEWKVLPANCATRKCMQQFIPEFPFELTWTLAFDGRSLGTITSRVAPDPPDSDWRAMMQIISEPPLPAIGKQTEEFAGFPGAPVLRPLVAISQPNSADPDVWKPFIAVPANVAPVRAEFRKKYPRITNCEVEESREYRDAEIKVNKSYAAKTGWKLFSLGIKGCDASNLGATAGLDYEWFTIDPSGTVHYLASNLVLVDAGDYDKSGHSQVLFMIDDYNRGGYVLFYDNFQKQATLEYHFH